MAKRSNSISIDLNVIFRILDVISDQQPHIVNEITAKAGLSKATTVKYIPLLELLGLVETRGRKPKRVLITEKGLRIYTEMLKLYGLLGIQVP